MDTVYFSWLESPVDIDPGVQLPQFELVDTVLYDCSQNYTAGKKNVIRTRGRTCCHSDSFVLRLLRITERPRLETSIDFYSSPPTQLT